MPLVRYSLLRLGLFVVALVGLWLAGMGGWLLVVAATVVAVALSYLLLAGPRAAAVQWFAQRRLARPQPRSGVAADAAAEDAAVDAATGEPSGPLDGEPDS